MHVARGFINGTVAAIMVLSMTALSGMRVAAAPSHATVTLNLAGWASSPTEPDNLRKVLANFEKKYPSIKVNYQVVNTNFDTVMRTRAVAGTAPDVFYADAFWIQGFAADNLIQPLEKYATKDKSFNASDFYKPLTKALSYKGKVYAFPKDYSTLGMWYNKSMFSAAKISKPPATWADLQKDACKLTNKSNRVYGTVIPADAARWYAFVYAAGGQVLNSSQTKAVLDSAATRKALDFYAGLIKKGCAATPSDVGAGWPGEAFGKGNAAIVFEGPWLTAPMKEQYPDVKYGLATLPKGPKGYGNLNYTVGYAMYSKTKHSKEAWTLISYLTGRTGMAQWVNLGGFPSPRKSVKSPPGTSVFQKGVKYSHQWGFPPGFNKANDAINNDLTKVFKGQMSTADAVKDMQAQAQRALSAP